MHGVLNEQIDWYEAALPVQERKRRGHFSTPQLLVEHILDACGYTADADLRGIRVLDPACGSGNFLAGAARRLVTFATWSRLSQAELALLIQRNIWGLDPDPISCLLAKMQLSAIHNAPFPLHIHQADGLALPWSAEPGIDLFLANPPYLAAKNADLSAYRSGRLRGQIDSYLLFLSLGLHIVRPGGWLGLVLPDPLLARANAAKERTDLLKHCTIHQLWHLADVFTAQVGAVVIVAQKDAPKSTHHVTWVRHKWGRVNDIRDRGQERQVNPTVSTIPQSLFLRQPGAEFRYLLNSEHGQAVERLRAYFDETPAANRQFAPLNVFLSICRGEEIGRKSVYLVRQNMASTPPPLSPGGCPGKVRADAINANQVCYPVLRGGRDIRPYATSFDGWWIDRKAVTKPLERYLAPKLLVVKSTGRLQAALDMQGHVALQTLYVLHSRTQEDSIDDLYFFLALLNSRLLQTYVYTLYTAYKWVQPQIEQHVLAHLPVPLIDSSEKQQIINKAKQLVRACSEVGLVVEWKGHIQRMYEEQERAICALYHRTLP